MQEFPLYCRYNDIIRYNNMSKNLRFLIHPFQKHLQSRKEYDVKLMKGDKSDSQISFWNPSEHRGSGRRISY